MKKYDQIFALSLLFIGLVFCAGNVSAAPQADLQTQINGPASAAVYSPYLYTVTVENIGNSNAENVTVTVDLPLTDTSPTKRILGTLSGLQNRCQVTNNKLVCNLSRIKKNKNDSFTFSLALPVSTKTLEIKATAVTSSPESITGNNTASIIPALSYQTNQLVSANVLNSHCTGQGLTSYFECELFPSSISNHTATLNADRTITLPAGYTGQWDQPSYQQLHFIYFENYVQVAEFNGYATTANCFEGMTTFPNPTYSSPYRVCVQ